MEIVVEFISTSKEQRIEDVRKLGIVYHTYLWIVHADGSETLINQADIRSIQISGRPAVLAWIAAEDRVIDSPCT